MKKATPTQVRKWLRETRLYKAAVNEVTWAAVKAVEGGASLPIVFAVTAVHVESGNRTTERLAITDFFEGSCVVEPARWPYVVNASRLQKAVPKPSITKEVHVSFDADAQVSPPRRPQPRRRNR